MSVFPSFSQGCLMSWSRVFLFVKCSSGGHCGWLFCHLKIKFLRSLGIIAISFSAYATSETTWVIWSHCGGLIELMKPRKCVRRSSKRLAITHRLHKCGLIYRAGGQQNACTYYGRRTQNATLAKGVMDPWSLNQKIWYIGERIRRKQWVGQRKLTSSGN